MVKRFIAHPVGQQNDDTFRQFQELQITLREIQKELDLLRAEIEAVRGVVVQ